MSSEDERLRLAYHACQELAGAHYENFPVASWLVPAPIRPHVAAVYAFARTADDIADEDGPDPSERLRWLDAWHARLDASRDRPAARATHLPAPLADRADLVFLALADTIRRFSLPVHLFEDLLDAFRQDVTVHRYGSWAEVDDYCRRSANPVGRLVLRLFGYADERLDRWSDAICTALQLTNFWQDFGVDFARGRLYVPEAEWRLHGARLEALDPQMRSLPAEWQQTLEACTARTRALFLQGRPLLGHVSGRLRWELRATWQGGRRILELLEQGRFDPAAVRPALGPVDALVVGWRTLL